MSETTPMMQQYAELKARYSDAILFFRLGDFYEMFRRDAEEAARILGVTLTQRQGIPMCGVPYHARDGYIARLLEAGKKVAICEQMKLPEGGRGIAEREVVEVITPGTVVDDAFLQGNENNYLFALSRYHVSESAQGGGREQGMAFAYADLSTGEFAIGDTGGPDDPAEVVRRELARLRPGEVLVQESLYENDDAIRTALRSREQSVIERRPDWDFDQHAGRERLVKHLGTANLKGFGVSDEDPGIACAGVLLGYLEETARSVLSHMTELRRLSDEAIVSLDESTQRNLELIRSLNDDSRRFSLLGTIDYTRTAMGARRLHQWIMSPLRSMEDIRKRQDRVSELYRGQDALTRCRRILGGVLDLERLTARVGMDRAHGKDLTAVLEGVRRATHIRQTLDDAAVGIELIPPQHADSVQEVVERLEAAITDNPSVVLTEGNLIKRGYNSELDELHRLRDEGASILEEYVKSERERTGISSLKIRYNKVIGHFLEVTKAQADRVPPEYIRRQSLSNAERFTTERLGELEDRLNSAQEKIVDLEQKLFLEVRDFVKERLSSLIAVARNVAALDALQSLAYAATVSGYVRPHLVEEAKLDIRGGRHPVVEATAESGRFVPNDIVLGGSEAKFALVTGPNMAGKSTYLRQTALIVLLAHTGSFVPADDATVGLVDRIFCRVGASDNLARGESTFLVEMNETANILRNAGRQSLIVMDEVGRGTGTKDGLAIAQAVCEHILNEVDARTLFATHYHQLVQLQNPGIRNLSMAVQEEGDDVVFLKRVQAGPSSHSYGIHVARLAGLPEQVLSRAAELLSVLQDAGAEPGNGREPSRSMSGAVVEDDAGRGDKDGPHTREDGRRSRDRAVEPRQESLFPDEDMLRAELLSLDVERMTPLEALNTLARLQKELSCNPRNSAGTDNSNSCERVQGMEISPRTKG